MFDFRLQVFYTVAKRLNFTRAAEELFITQPAVTKHIHEIEKYFNVKLFERNGTRIKLTPAGETLLQHTEELFALHRNIAFEMSTLSRQHKGRLRIGASTTIAQYVLPPLLAAFNKKMNGIKITLHTDNTEKIEAALLNKEIDLGIIEGYSKNRSIKYDVFTKDEIVLVARTDSPIAKKTMIKPEELKQIPLLLREPGSGTLEVIAHALKPFNIKIAQLKNEMQLASTESMKQYLLYSDCMAFVSKHAVSTELLNKTFTVIHIKGLQIVRDFYFIQPQGEAGGLPETFIKFAHRYNFK
jgi:DNA-binding transcriptional LysR family regulator